MTVSIVNGCFVTSTAGVQNNGGPAGPELRFDANGGTAAGCTAGTTSCPDLGLFVDFTGTAGHTVTVLYQFFATGTATVTPISLQGFPVRDIDFSSGQYQDRIGLTAVNHAGGATINPDGISPFTATPNYTIATPFVTGVSTNVAVTDPNGWVSFNFATHLIDSMTLTYSDPASLDESRAAAGPARAVSPSRTTALATRAVISDVRAYADNGQSWVEWETASEIGTRGFNIYRLDPATDGFVQLNDHLLPALGGARQGGVYRFPDPDVVPGRQSTYGFEEIEAKGGKHTYGPYTVTAGAGKPVTRKAVEGPALSAGNRAPRTDGFEGAAHALDARATGAPLATQTKVALAAATTPSATKAPRQGGNHDPHPGRTGRPVRGDGRTDRRCAGRCAGAGASLDQHRAVALATTRRARRLEGRSRRRPALLLRAGSGRHRQRLHPVQRVLARSCAGRDDGRRRRAAVVVNPQCVAFRFACACFPAGEADLLVGLGPRRRLLVLGLCGDERWRDELLAAGT